MSQESYGLGVCGGHEDAGVEMGHVEERGVHVVGGGDVGGVSGGEGGSGSDDDDGVSGYDDGVSSEESQG